MLHDVDALLEALEHLIIKKVYLKQAAMQQLLTGRIRLPGIYGDWEKVEFGAVATIRDAKTTAPGIGTDAPCVELDCIEGGNGRLLKTTSASAGSVKFVFKSGDVLFGRLRAYLRKHWFASFDGLCSTEIWPLVPLDGRVSPRFLYLLVQTDNFADSTEQAYGTHMPRTDWSVVSRYSLLLPKPEEQDAISAVIFDIEKELAALEARRDKMRDLKTAIAQELLTGKTRLVAAEPACA